MGAGVEEASAGVPPRSSEAHRVQANAAHMVDTKPPVWDLKAKINGVGVSAKEKESPAKAMAEKKWNTKNLGSRMAVDAACAATAGGLVAPLISMIDK
jgi:hypothetical protein